MSTWSGSAPRRCRHNWQSPNANARCLDRHDRPNVQVVLDRRDVCRKNRGLRNSGTDRFSTKQNNGWLGCTSQGQQRAKVAVCRDDDTLFRRGAVEHDLIVRCDETVMLQVNSIVPR